MAAGDLQRRAAEVRLTGRPTLFALATGAPPTAIAIVRLSGTAAIATLVSLTRRSPPPPRQLALRTLVDPVDGAAIDHALVVMFPAPDTATGDDVVELHLHGGVAVVAAVLAVLDRCGLERAGRGAFARRAFDNGRLDLSAVAALGDLVAAETDGQRRAALAQTGGDLARHVTRWRAVLTTTRAELEATLDFAEEEGVGSGLSPDDRARLADLAQELAAACDAAERGGLLRSGVTVAITGPPNAGKSTLLNALARRDAAMVSPLPGTTRDLVEARVVLGRVPVTLVDTAGLRPTGDPLEAEGIRRGVARAAEAQIVVALGPADRVGAIRIAAKSDLGGPAGWQDGILHLSAATGDGLDLLTAEIEVRVAAIVAPLDPPLVAHGWQRSALAAAVAAIGAALEAGDAVLAAEMMRRATSELERLIGRVAPEELLGEIFGRFCVGK